MKIHIFGSCSGTEPMPNRHHTAWALEYNGRLYWFDAGETCSHTAYLMGLDPRTIEAVFISHTHIDHVGGLANLFWTIRKLIWVDGRQPNHDFELYIPRLSTWETILAFMKNVESGFPNTFTINAHEITEDGVIFDNGEVRVEALHNRHIHTEAPWYSYSYRITAGGKTVIYSGDVKSTSDLDPFLQDGCDLLLHETGHHSPEVPAAYIREKGYQVGRLAYLHHGRIILKDRDNAVEKIRSVWGDNFTVCDDAQTLPL